MGIPAKYSMGRVRTKTVKKASRDIIENYYQRLTNDFELNKRIIDEVADVQTKRLRNKIAGFTTHLVKRIQRGPVRGISLMIQEEKREKFKESLEPKVQNIAEDNDALEILRVHAGYSPTIGLQTA